MFWSFGSPDIQTPSCTHPHDKAVLSLMYTYALVHWTANNADPHSGVRKRIMGQKLAKNVQVRNEFLILGLYLNDYSGISFRNLPFVFIQMD